MVIDLSEVERLASSVLAKLISLKNQLGVGGGRLGLKHVHPDLMEVFRITRLDRVFDVEP
jgi:anti-sigma B factor antagonist